MNGAACGCCYVRNPRSCFPCMFTTGFWFVRIYGLFHRRLCKVTKTASQSSVDLHCLCMSWEMFRTRQIEKVETGRSVLLPWAELDVKSQRGGTQVSWTDGAAGSYCHSQHVKPCLPMVSWAGCSSTWRRRACCTTLLSCCWGLSSSRTSAEPGDLVTTYSMRQRLCLDGWHISAGTTLPAQRIHLCVAAAELRQLPQTIAARTCPSQP